MQQIHQRIKKHYSYHKHFLPHYFVAIVYGSFLIFGLYTLFPPGVRAETSSLHRLDQAIEVSIWGWVNKDSLTVRSNYDTPLKATLNTDLYPLKSTLRIKPEDLLYPNTSYQLEIESRNWLGIKTVKVIKFKTTELPLISLAKAFQDPTQIAADTRFQFKLSGELNIEYFSFSSEPVFEYTKKIDKNILIIDPKAKLRQGQTYRFLFTLKSNSLGEQILYQDSFSVIDPLELVSSMPANNSDNIAKQTRFEFVFNKDVNQTNFQNLVKIEPKTLFSTIWKDSKTVTLSPDKELTTNSRYIVTLADTITGLDGSQLPETKIIAFTTAGKVTVVGFGPVGSSTNPSSTITVTFNQPVDQNSAQSSFSISPAIAGTFSWNGTTLSYKTAGLGLLTTYTVNIQKGVKSLGGEDSVQNYSHSFTTTSERSRTIGYSVRKRAITATYFGVGPKRILLVGSLHGSESNTGNMLSSWISFLRANQKAIGNDRTFIIVPYSNPDGRATNNRFNANNVDLNRNFGTPDWQALSYWQNRSYPTGGGTTAFSEPESRSLRDLILSENVTHIITYHASANMVLGDGIANNFGDWYANLTGYTRIKSSDQENEGGVSALGYIITGTLEEWASLQGKVTLVVEFISQTANEYNRNLPALKGLLTYPI